MFMTKEDLVKRINHMKEEVFKIEEKLYANGTFELTISVNMQPPKESIEFGCPNLIKKLNKGFQT